MKMMTFEAEMQATIPSLKAFAISLCGNVDRADDLVQETMLRALANRDSFTLGTNMVAWLFTILRNHFRSEYRKRRREVEDADGHYASTLISAPAQTGAIEFGEFQTALNELPPDQREALILVGASGFTYEEAALISNCAVGTIKSRVFRARTALAHILGVEGAQDFAAPSGHGREMPVDVHYRPTALIDMPEGRMPHGVYRPSPRVRAKDDSAMRLAESKQSLRTPARADLVFSKVDFYLEHSIPYGDRRIEIFAIQR